ncbi:MAG: hypothetical protein J6N21_13310 [Butyrivibrio sp.]|nr:hypothetical protein [Butyrivibrio sp.]
MIKKFNETVDRIEGKPISREMAKFITIAPIAIAIVLPTIILMAMAAYELGRISMMVG